MKFTILNTSVLPFAMAVAVAAAPATAQGTDWRLVPDHSVGAEYEFTRIQAVLPLTHGSVAIADDRNGEVAVFTADGTYSHNIGGRGRGPGEFVRLRSIGLHGDTVWAIDGAEPRASLFRTDGSFISSIRNDHGAWITHLLRNGALGLTAAPLGSKTMFRDEVLPLLLLTRAGATLDTLGLVPSRNRNLILGPRPDGGYTIGTQRFTDAGLTAVSPGGELIYVVDRSVAVEARSAAIQVTAIEPTGDTAWSRFYSYRPKRTPRGVIDSLQATLVPSLKAKGHSDREIREAVFIPGFLPPVTDVFVGTDSALWLRREEADARAEYWIIASDGTHIGSLHTAAGVRLRGANSSKVWGVHLDEYDVPSITQYRLAR